MAIKSQIDALLQEKMDRKDFLKYAGTVALGIIGVTGLVRMLVGDRGSTGSTSEGASKSQGSGYGSSSYGK
ncbi:MAG: hypothetical protein JWN12_328 [Candidatus Saccharibacteria bacterium]|nr:hypothetical protein [Candidatus Saccharibacteria bacterium]